MKILLTGSDGMLGSAFLDVLNKEDVLAVNKNELDITVRASVFSVVKDFKPDILINCAAYTAVDDAEDNKDLAFSINADAVKNLVDACNENGVFLVHISTDYVFDGENENGYKEYAKRNPINVYGKSKARAEEIIEYKCDKYAIFRSSWLFGPNGKNFVDTMLRLADERDELKVVNDQKGCPTYTYDLANAIYDFVKNPQIGIFHLTNDSILTWYEFALKIFESADKSVKVLPVSSEEFPQKATRPKNSVLINTKLPHLPKIEDALLRYMGNPL